MKIKTSTDLQYLTSRLNDLIIGQVEMQINMLGGDWKRKFETLKFEINQYYNNAVELHEDAKENNFTVNMIEQEGYLRAMTLVKNLIEEQLENNP